MRASISSLVDEGPNVATIFVLRNVNLHPFYDLIDTHPAQIKMGLYSPILITPKLGY
jgi:hypothetical protein